MDEGVWTAHARLEKVVGRNALGVNSFAIHAASNTILYVAGATVVFSSSTFPEGHLVSPSQQNFTCVAISSCGRFAATGEAAPRPCVRIWEVRNSSGAFVGRFLRAMELHTGAIKIVKFTPDDAMLISVGGQQDAHIAAWDWKTGAELGTGRLTSTANTLAISYDSSTCVTVGAKSVKYWHLPNKAKNQSGLTSRSAILADRRNATFVDATFVDSSNRLMTVTANGHILEFNEHKKFVKGYVWGGEFRATCIARISEGLLVGCNDGVIRLYSLTGDDLDFITDVKPPVHIGVDPSKAYNSNRLCSAADNPLYPEVRCITATPGTTSFVVGFADRTLIQMSRETHQWFFRRACLSHVGPVNAVEMYPSTSEFLPPGTFVTAGADGTVRFWCFEDADRHDWNNVLSPNLLKILYLEEDFNALVENVSGGEIDERAEDFHAGGVTCLKISTDGRILVAGTKSGILHLVDVTFSDMPPVDVINAHESEVTCVEFSDRASDSQEQLLASGGRDRLVHVFRRVPFSTRYAHCAVLDENQHAVRALRFGMNNGDLKLFVAAGDKNISAWIVVAGEELKVHRERQILTPTVVCDMELLKNDANDSINLLAAGQDRNLWVMTPLSQVERQLKGTDGESGSAEIIRLAVDASESLVATICTNRLVYVVDVGADKVMAALDGFGAPPLDVAFSSNSRSLLVTTANGGIFVWQLSKALVQRCIDNLRGSGRRRGFGSTNDAFKDQYLGVPDFGSSVSLISAGGVDGDDESTGGGFGRPSTSGRRSRSRRQESSAYIGIPSCSRVGDSSFSPTVQLPSAVERRSTSNLFGNEHLDVDFGASGTQSDFVSSRRQPEEEPSDRLSPLLLNADEQLRAYQSSKSMMNLRDAGGVRVPTAKELMMSHIANTSAARSGGRVASSRATWDDLPRATPHHEDWQPQTISRGHPNHSPGMFISSPPNNNNNVNKGYHMHTKEATPPIPPRAMSRSFVSPPSESALSQIKSASQTPNGEFQRRTADRSSLTKKFVDGGGVQPKTVWSPQTLASSAAPRRSSSNLYTAAALHHSPSTGAASVISRRQSEAQRLRLSTAARIREISVDDVDDDSDEHGVSTTTSTPKRRPRPRTTVVDTRHVDVAISAASKTPLPTARATKSSGGANIISTKYSWASKTPTSRRAEDLPMSAAHLRSRSQSPNKLALMREQQQRDDLSSSSPPSSVGANTNSRGLTRHLQQKRRDSDMSYPGVRSTSRGPMGRGGDPEMRKSTDALNKLLAVRSKLHQSSENLRKSSDNLAMHNDDDESAVSSSAMRTRSISNIRVANQLESFGTFDVDVRNRSGSSTSLAHSRMLARSVGNVALEGASAREVDSPSRRLANTIQLMRKASNSDLTQAEQYDDAGSPFASRIRGAVQKKVDRYRPRNRAGPPGRNQTSEESDSNTSDASPLNQSINKRALTVGSGNRSTTTSDWSPTSSVRSSQANAATSLGSARRLYEQQRVVASSPRRASNYLVQKMNDSMAEGPDLGSDDSPRSSVNSHDWQSLLETTPDGTANPLIRHVQDCLEQYRVIRDKLTQARKLVDEDSTLSTEQKKIVLCEIDRFAERPDKPFPVKADDRTNGNEYAPIRGPQVYGVLKQNLASHH